MNIEEAFRGFNTPKVTAGYLKPYENNFERYRDKVKTFCELGVSHGASLIAWKKYFPEAQIVGIDNDAATVRPDTGFPNFAHKYLGDQADDISIEIGDALDVEFLKSTAEKYGGFDIVLDDCSHLGIQMKTSFEVLWNYTRFVYGIEDLQTQFNPKYIESLNFIDYIETLVNGDITDIKNKTTFTSNEKTISQINIENYIVFIHKEM